MSDTLETLASPQLSGELIFDQLTKEFRSNTGLVRAVDHIDLTIKPGEFVTLLGPSGCGKTTTLRMIAGFENPTAGRVLLDKTNMVATPPNQRPMAMVFQSYALFPHLSVRENVSYGLKLKKLSKEEIAQEVDLALVSMNLTHLADRSPAQLSGGQQQRVALARAMVMRPKVLLFDEPLSNLDAKLRTHMRLEIRRLQQRLGITSVYVTHDQSEAMSMSDRIVVMNNGRIEQVDTPENIYRHPANVFVADFIGRANFLPVQQATLVDNKTAEVKALGQTATVARHPEADTENLVLLVRPESVTVSPAGIDRGGEVGGKLGRVLAAVFYGESVEYEIETEYGTVVAVVSDPRTESLLEEGDLVSVEFNASRAWLLPDHQA